MTPLSIAPKRVHLIRLLAIRRPAGWPRRDAVEIDLLQRSLSPRDRLADRVARQLMDAGRVAWRALWLRSQAGAGGEPA